MNGIAGIVPSIKRNFKCLRERFCPQELDSWRAALTAGLLDDTRFWQYTPFEAELCRLAHPQIDARHGAKLAAQANLAQQHSLWREPPLAKTRRNRRGDAQINRWLIQREAARHVDV